MIYLFNVYRTWHAGCYIFFAGEKQLKNESETQRGRGTNKRRNATAGREGVVQ